jgi:hypothetical protein
MGKKLNFSLNFFEKDLKWNELNSCLSRSNQRQKNFNSKSFAYTILFPLKKAFKKHPKFLRVLVIHRGKISEFGWQHRKNFLNMRQNEGKLD